MLDRTVNKAAHVDVRSTQNAYLAGKKDEVFTMFARGNSCEAIFTKGAQSDKNIITEVCNYIKVCYVCPVKDENANMESVRVNNSSNLGNEICTRKTNKYDGKMMSGLGEKKHATPNNIP